MAGWCAGPERTGVSTDQKAFGHLGELLLDAMQDC